MSDKLDLPSAETHGPYPKVKGGSFFRSRKVLIVGRK